MKRYVVLGVLLALSACMTIQGRREKFVQANPGLTDEQRAAIMQGTLVACMTKDMVRASWGEPLDVITEILNGRNVESWIYQEEYYDRVNTYKVRFENDLLAEVKLVNRQQRAYSPRSRHNYWRHYPEFP